MQPRTSAHARSGVAPGVGVPTLEGVYRMHADFVWRSALRFGIRTSAAEDVVHEVFLVVGRRLPEFRPGSSVRAWLYGITRGVCANRRRSDDRRQRRHAELQLVEPDGPATPEELARRAQAVSLVQAFLDTLEEPQRQVFALADLEGMTGPEIAQAFDEPLNTIYSRLRLARRKFKAYVARLQEVQR